MSDDDRTIDADPSTLDRLRRAAQAADPGETVDPDATVDVDAAGLQRLRQAARDAETTPPVPVVGSQEWLDDMPTPPAGTPRIDPATPSTAPVATPAPPTPHQTAQPDRPGRQVRPAFALDLPDPRPRRPASATSDDSERWRPPPRSMQPVAETTTVDHAVKWRVATIALALIAGGLLAWLIFAGSGSTDDVDPVDIAVTTIPLGEDPGPVVVQQGEGGAGG